MKPIAYLSRHFSNVVAPPNLGYPPTQIVNLTEEICCAILDGYPDLSTLRKLHCKLFLDPGLRSNPSLGIKLMRAYAARGAPGVTRKVFDEITDKNVVFFNVMIRSYVNNRMYIDGIRIFRGMSGQGGCVPDNYSYPCVLKACSGSGNLVVGLQVHCRVMRVGLDSNVFVGNGLVSMYGKCRCLVEARRVLDEMPRKDVVSWNSMVAGYAQSGRFDDALEVCKEMEGFMKPDSGTMASLLPAVANTTSDNVFYVKSMFEKIGGRSLVSWNAMIAVYMKNGMPNEAVGLYSQMKEYGIEPDAVSAASVLPACGDLSALSMGRRIHEYVERKKFRPNLLLENALIDMYAKSGCLGEARAVFDGMEFRDVVSWTSMFCAYGISGHGHDAVELFQSMLNSSLLPDSVAFVSVLAACSHSGLLDEGRHIFDLMALYGVAPKIEHFSCLVDLLGRAGKINEAYGIIRQMPMQPNERVWGALLSSCRVYNNMDIGLVAADSLFQLSPEPSGYYVLLSNIYAKAGRWQDVSTIRSIMQNKGIKKKPGISNVELNGHVHTFLVGDRSHPQSKNIYEELEVLVGKMKEIGYMPETDSALHDVEEEDKESHLAVHSEKLAIIFALLNTNPGTPIRITKNLRVCGDCHVAAKFLSTISQREIVVRDTHRFHYFNNGGCSCGDYW